MPLENHGGVGFARSAPIFEARNELNFRHAQAEA
jgi:hypothetical protein